MTPDRESAAGLVERLESLADLDSRAGAPLAKAMREAAQEIRDLVVERNAARQERDRAKAAQEEGLNRAVKAELERDEAERAHAEVENHRDKLRDLHRRASEETGELLARALKAEKERDQAEHARAEAMTLVELLKAELSHTQSELAGMRRTHMRMSATPDDFRSGGQVYDPDAARAFIEKAKS